MKPIYASRKLWAAAICLSITLALYATRQIDGKQLSDALIWIGGIFIGATALEDGMRNLIRIWVGQKPLLLSQQQQPAKQGPEAPSGAQGAPPPEIKRPHPILPPHIYPLDYPLDGGNLFNVSKPKGGNGSQSGLPLGTTPGTGADSTFDENGLDF